MAVIIFIYDVTMNKLFVNVGNVLERDIQSTAVLYLQNLKLMIRFQSSVCSKRLTNLDSIVYLDTEFFVTRFSRYRR